MAMAVLASRHRLVTSAGALLFAEASRGVGGWPARRLLQLALLDGPRARGARVRSPSVLSCVGVIVVYGHQMFKPLAVLALHRLLHSDLSLGSSITWHVDLDALE
jgi:hypothetical protein